MNIAAPERHAINPTVPSEIKQHLPMVNRKLKLRTHNNSMTFYLISKQEQKIKVVIHVIKFSYLGLTINIICVADSTV